MPRALWTPSAISDLENILFYIATHDLRPSVAQNIGMEIHALCDKIALQPSMGQANPELGKELRCFPYKRWIIVYRHADNCVHIIAIVDAARDYASLFKI